MLRWTYHSARGPVIGACISQDQVRGSASTRERGFGAWVGNKKVEDVQGSPPPAIRGYGFFVMRDDSHATIPWAMIWRCCLVGNHSSKEVDLTAAVRSLGSGGVKIVVCDRVAKHRQQKRRMPSRSLTASPPIARAQVRALELTTRRLLVTPWVPNTSPLGTWSVHVIMLHTKVPGGYPSSAILRQ